MDILKSYCKNTKKVFDRFFKTQHAVDNSQTSEVDTPVSSSVIPVSSKTEKNIKSGFALLITHEIFDDHRLKTRSGTLKDEEQINILFINFGFTVKSLKNPTRDDIFEEVNKAAAALDASQHDCILVVVNTHGHAGGILYAKDKAYSVDDICKPFFDNEKLLQVPKIFIFQACRGGTNDKGLILQLEEGTDLEDETKEFHSVSSHFSNDVMETDAKASNTSNMVTNVWSPSKPNVLLVFSCVPDHMSWRHPEKGSLYMQQFCDVLSHSNRDITSQLTQVHRQLMTMEIEDQNNKEIYKQACSYTSSLTYKIYFHKQKKSLIKVLT